MSLELQRFWAISKSDRGKLCAKCVCGVVSVSRLEARPGPAAAWGPVGAHRYRGLARRHSNFARNSPATFSNIEFASLELQRFWAVLKSDRGKLCAKFVWRWPLQPMLAPSTGRTLHRGLALRFLRRPPAASHLWRLECCCVGSLDLCLVFGTKFSLLGFLVVRTVQNSPCMHKKRQIGPFWASGESFVPEVGPCGSCWESFVPHMRRGRVSRESFVPEGPGVVVVGRVMPCSGVVLVPVGGLWQYPGAVTGTAAWPSVFWCSTHRRWWGCARNSSPCVLKMTQNWRFMACWANSFAG